MLVRNDTTAGLHFAVSLAVCGFVASSCRSTDDAALDTEAAPASAYPRWSSGRPGDGLELDRAKVELGRRLFFDPRLSRTDTVSCGSCHDPAKGFSNGERFATGIDGQQTTRHVPALINVALSTTLFWDGRAASLEEQALMPIQEPAEMGMPLARLVGKLNSVREYRRLFHDVFGGPVTAGRIAAAIAEYERSIVSHEAPFDRYAAGERSALSPAAVRGLELFFGPARCSLCHSGPNFTDNKFHNVLSEADPGRFAVTHRDADLGAFKTPTLRDVARTSPYMHDGRFATLKKVVEHYNFGAVTGEANRHRDELLQVLYLGEDQVDDLVTFLEEGLTSGRWPY